MRNPPARVLNIARHLVDVGVEQHPIEGKVLQVTGIARTVADCFRFRSRIGLDLAKQTLADARRSRR